MQWFDLEETSTGKLHLKLEWLSLLATPEKLDQVKQTFFLLTEQILSFAVSMFATDNEGLILYFSAVTVLSVFIAQSGAAKCASRQKPG